MQMTLRVQTTVLPGHRIEISAPELPEGGTVEVLVFVRPTASPPPGGVADFLNSLPPGPRSYPTWNEFERQFQAERDAWER